MTAMLPNFARGSGGLVNAAIEGDMGRHKVNLLGWGPGILVKSAFVGKFLMNDLVGQDSRHDTSRGPAGVHPP